MKKIKIIQPNFTQIAKTVIYAMIFATIMICISNVQVLADGSIDCGTTATQIFNGETGTGAVNIGGIKIAADKVTSGAEEIRIIHFCNGTTEIESCGPQNIDIEDDSATCIYNNKTYHVEYLTNAGETKDIYPTDYSILFGLDGNDILKTGDAELHIYGGEGNDSIVNESGGRIDHDEMSFTENEPDECGSDQHNAPFTLVGGIGRDSICGKMNNVDHIFGQAGGDWIWGQQGDDIIQGGEDNDKIAGNSGNDYIDGGNEADLIYGGDGEDDILGGSSDDEIYGGAMDDNIWGLEGEDIIHGNSGSDLIVGGNGQGNNEQNDILDGDGGNDYIYDFDVTGSGADTFFGGPDQDYIRIGLAGGTVDGEGDVDYLNACDSSGVDTLTGGTNIDTFVVNENDIITDFNSSEDIQNSCEA